MGASAPVKYHYLYSLFTYSMKRSWDVKSHLLVLRRARVLIRVEDIVRWGVWLGRHICKKITQVS